MHSLRFGAASILGVAAVTVTASISACSSKSGSGGNFGSEDAANSTSGGSNGTSSNGGSNGASNGGGSSGTNGGSSSNGSSSSMTSSSGPSSGGTSSGVPSDAAADVGGPMFTDSGIPICGKAPCDLKTNTCCVSQFLMGMCIPHSQSCPNLWAAFMCAQESDCANGQVCCGLADANAMTATTSCQTVANSSSCPGTNTSTMAEAQVCQSDMECRNHQACLQQSCVISSTVTAHLKMCGLQNRAPFNCSLG
jgi:hypothetical protein